MLLEREDINPNQPDTWYGRTPLSWAAENGHDGTVKMLLEREEVNPDQPDTEHGQTPLSWAAANGHDGIVEMLLEREDVIPNQSDTEYGWTPLLWAAARGHVEVVKMLLKRQDVNLDQPDTKYGQTPLSWAAARGHVEVVKVLFKRHNADPDQPGTKYGQTPLPWAADSAHDGTVNLLIERNRIQTTMPDHISQTPQSLALPELRYGVVRIPPEQNTANCAQADSGGQISFSPSSMPQNECVAEMQFRSHDPNTDMTDFSGQLAPLPASHHNSPHLSDLGDPVSKPTDSGLSTQSPRRPQPFSIWPLKLWYPPRKTDTHPNTQSILSFAVGRSFIIASLICLFAFLLYTFPSPLLDISFFCK